MIPGTKNGAPHDKGAVHSKASAGSRGASSTSVSKAVRASNEWWCWPEPTERERALQLAAWHRLYDILFGDEDAESARVA